MALLSKSVTSFACIFGVLLCVLLVFATTASYGCIFDEPAFQKQMAEDLAKPAPANTGIVAGRAGTYSPIRITVSTLDLDDSSKYCTAAGDTRSDMQGGTRTCTADDVFSAAKKTELKNTILPAAMKLLQEAFAVNPVIGNLLVGSTSQCSGGFTIPSSHVAPGVANTDLVLYVAAAPTAVGNVAWAATCQETADATKRAVVGRVNFGPYYLQRSKMALRDIISTGVHEILHAMGYSYSKFSGVVGMTSSSTARGITKNFVVAAKAKDEARKWVGCGSIPGVELENEGGSGTANSHPDRRIYMDDVMAGAGGEALSTVTLSVMEALNGAYQANFSAAQNMVTGKGLGCGYTDGDCNTAAGGLNKIWCSGTAATCNSNLKAIGPCSSGFLTDDCRYSNAYSNKKCYDDSQTDDADSGDTFHANARCFETTGGFKKSGAGTTSSLTQRCFKAQCFANILSFAIGRDSVGYVTCVAGSSASYSGYDGSITCPNITYMCDSLQLAANSTAAPDNLIDKVALTYGKTNRAADYIYTTKLTLTLSGSNWNNVINGYFSDLFMAMQGDVAQILGLELQQVWIRSVSGTTTTVQFVVTVNSPKLSSVAIRGSFASYLGRRAWMPRTAELYASRSGSSDNAVLGAAGAEDKPENACTPYMPSFEDDTKCNGFIAGLAIAAAALVALIVVTIYCCCCKYQDPPSKLDKSVKYEVQRPATVNSRRKR